MTMRLWRWDNDEMHIVSDQGDHLAIEEFIMYVNGLETEADRRSTAPPDAAEHGASFIEFKCHKCGVIIDAVLTQMPRR